MSASPSTIPAVSPLWHLIHFDVHCARCSHNLHGQSEPVCPACHLEFTWEQAAPLDQLTCGKCSYHLYGLSDSRCPECGTAVDWNEALLRYRRREKPLFEYHWRDRPIRSFFHTWRLALRPKRLWQTVDIHDPPQRGPLIAWTSIFLFLTTISVPFWLGISMTFGSFRSYWTQGLSWSYFFDFLIRNWTRLVSSPSIWLSGLLFAFWWIFSLCALLVFRQSMRLCKVRTTHVLRVCAYGLAPLLPIYVFLAYLSTFFFVSRVRGFSVRSGLLNPMSILGLAGVVVMVWSLRQAYRNYIRMPHALGVAIASQVIAILATMAVPPVLVALLWGRW